MKGGQATVAKRQSLITQIKGLEDSISSGLAREDVKTIVVELKSQLEAITVRKILKLSDKTKRLDTLKRLIDAHEKAKERFMADIRKATVEFNKTLLLQGKAKIEREALAK